MCLNSQRRMVLESIVESAEELPQVEGIGFEGMYVPPLYPLAPSPTDVERVI
jgi:hypothetical protein